MYKYLSQVISDIKARVSIEDLVSQYVVLKKMGNSLKGLCPFHAEKTPSFMVSPEKGICWCFGCNKGGDIFNFIQEIENIEFGDALKILAERAEVELEEVSQKDLLKKNEKMQLLDVNEEVTRFYENKLWQSAEGEKVLAYLQKRGLNEDTIKKFRLGYAPDSFDETGHFLLKKGFSRSHLLATGLALAKDTSGNNIYDRFRGRLMFPVMDAQGKVVGFGGRALAKDQEPKYLNTPETKLYQKGGLLYGFQITKNVIKKIGSVLIVEGYMDFLAAFQSGVENVVAVNGIALTQKQLTLLKPISKEVILAFDNDSAGREAQKRAYELAREFDFEIKSFVLPEGKDIAEFCKDKGKELIELVKKSPGFIEAFYAEVYKKYGHESVSEKRKILSEVGPFLLKLKSSIERDFFIKKMALDLSLTEVQVYDEIRNYSLSKNNNVVQSSLSAVSQKFEQKLTAEMIILGINLEFPQVFQDNNIDFEQVIISENLKTIYKKYREKYNPQSGKEAVFKQLWEELESSEKSALSAVCLYVNEKYQEFSNEALLSEVKSLVDKQLRESVNLRKKRLHKELLEAEKNNNSSKMTELLQELNRIHN